MVGITQPRRVAAVTIAKRVAKEMGVQVGTKVSIHRSITLQQTIAPDKLVTCVTCCSGGLFYPV